MNGLQLLHEGKINMTNNYVRRRDQLLILNLDKEIQVGRNEDLPLSIEKLEKANQDSPWVEDILKGEVWGLRFT